MSLLVRVDGAASVCVCVSVNLKIEKFPDATAAATTQSLVILRIKPKLQSISVHYLLDR